MSTPTTDQRQKSEQAGHAMPGGRFPIESREDLRKAISAVGRASADGDPSSQTTTDEGARSKVRRHIIAQAKRLGASDMVPDSWNADGTLKASAGPAHVTFADDPTMSASFAVEPERRVVSGVVVPWGAVAYSAGRRWRFSRDSLKWTDPRRVKLNFEHDRIKSIGVATELTSTDAGLYARFKIARGADGDRVLSLAEDGVLDGFSIEVDRFDDTEPDPTTRGVELVRSARLPAVALTAMPAYDDARITHVAASTAAQTKGNEMADTATATAEASATDDQVSFTQELDARFSALADRIGDTVTTGVTAAMTTAMEKLPHPHEEGPQTVRAARFNVVREEPVYTLNGVGFSLVRDAWYAGREHDQDAVERLRRYRAQVDDMSKLAESAKFATGSTSTLPEVIPPGYRPDLYVPELAQGRPFVNAMSRGTISTPSPFTVPVFGSATGVTGDHVEGTNPDDGTLDMESRTVVPQAVSGRLVLTREIVDASNPAIDQIALSTMREAYSRQTESKVYAMLNAAQADDTSGAQVYTAATADGAVLHDTVTTALANYQFERFAAPDNALMSRSATVGFATAKDTTGRPLIPSVGATNTNGIGNAIQQNWNLHGLSFVPAWTITGTAATDAQVFILKSSDAWAWESSLLTFRFEEKQGPALIELALFGYFGTHLLRPSGLAAIRVGG